MKKYSIFILTFAFSFGIYAQEENCPEPSKKAVKFFNKAQIARGSERKAMLFQATKIDPNYLEAFDALADLAESKEKNAMQPLDLVRAGNSKRKYWQKIVDICPEYRNYHHTLQLGDYYFSKREFENVSNFLELTNMTNIKICQCSENIGFLNVLKNCEIFKKQFVCVLR